MASVKDLKKRIGTVKNTQQTTRAMKMVSAAKLRRAQDAITAQRPYARAAAALMKTMLLQGDVQIESPFFKRAGEEGEKSEGGKRVLLVLVTSDRGLCGGFNGNIIKTASRWIKSNKDKYATIQLAFVGRRGHDFFKTKNFNLGPYFSEVGGKVTFAKAKMLADGLKEHFSSGQVDEVKVIYNEFKNAVSQVVRVEDFLPLSESMMKSDSSQEEAPSMLIVKPSPSEVLNGLLDKHFGIQALRILLDSQASEHGARMSAMENATKNAGEMIKKLTLQYNKQRQAGITKELLEIISGSESQKG